VELRRVLADGTVLRPVSRDDAQALLVAYLDNRSYLEPWEPVRPERFYALPGQVESLARMTEELASGTALPMVLVRDRSIIGRVTLSSIVRGAFQSAHLGYWIGQRAQGAGLMTAAVEATVEIARSGLGLHRLEAATLVHNIPSQRVLEKNGFESYGLARSYLQIHGRWQDHRIYQKILREDGPLP
jgi:ribosomal-protein-alanine N-acetyltransferase